MRFLTPLSLSHLLFLLLSILRYANPEPGQTHKDIQIVTSDGTTPKLLDSAPTGCDADFRYWEGRDDFSVTKMSALRIRFVRGVVSGWIDPKNDGNWKECFSNVVVPAMEGWFKEGEQYIYIYIVISTFLYRGTLFNFLFPPPYSSPPSSGAWLGLTATTGDLADNHDVSSFIVGLEDQVAPDPKDEIPRPVIIGSGSEEVDQAIRSSVAYETHMLVERLAALEHRFEYE